jgi:hypothetical protein
MRWLAGIGINSLVAGGVSGVPGLPIDDEKRKKEKNTWRLINMAQTRVTNLF